MRLVHCIQVLCLMAFAQLSFAYSSAVLLQYHFVGSDTPAITSVSADTFAAHLAWLRDNNFAVLALPEIVSTLKNGEEFTSDKVAGITFDDAGLSVCTTAWPILKKLQLPFTVFISTDSVERQFTSQCSWDMLKTMAESGLMTVGNHSHLHQHMVSIDTNSNRQWRKAVRKEIDTAQDLIEHHLGISSKLFAYPYGEYNSSLATLVEQLGYIGFGQHSGAIGHHSDFTALPRFPASGQYANLATLSLKLNSLAFPAEFIASADNPIDQHSANNPPRLTIKPVVALPKPINCFTAHGEPIQIDRQNGDLVAYSLTPLASGRNRYNCTSESATEGRFYWLAHQWLIE